jgi:transcriptional regulator with XRE-family HTH domain
MNEMLSSAYLDVLPAHPRPQPLESLNSYVKRVACANGIHHVNTFSHLTGVREPKHWLELRPAPDYGQLGTVTCCSDTELLAMTVYFLGRKFGREQSLGRFLAPNLARYQRWCPACLTERGCMKLPWYFLHLSGCPQHGIHLLDVCPHCQRPLRLKSASLSLHGCPHCAGDLRQAECAALSETEKQHCQDVWDDLAYLLTPQDWEAETAHSPVMAAFRQRLGFLRRASGVQAQQMAHQLGLSRNGVLAIENETRSGIGETLNDYLLYVDALGVQMREVFHDCAQAGYRHKDDLFAAELLRRTEAAIHQLKAAHIPVTQKRVSQALGYESAALRRYAPIHHLLHSEAAIRDRRTQEYEAMLCQRIQQVIETLNAKQEPVTKRKVGLCVGRDPKEIQKFYPDAYRILKEAVTLYQREKPLRQAQLRQRVEQALVLFRERGDVITQKTIAQHLGVTEAKLANYPEICACIAEQQRQVHEAWFAALKKRIVHEMEYLTAQAVFVSRGKLVQRLAIADHWFEEYPELMALWRAFDEAQRVRRETTLLARTQAAIDTCQAQNLPLTFRQVEALMGFSRSALTRYPRVFALLRAHGLVRARPDAKSVSQ